MTAVAAVVWSDYVCPWCWLGQSQTELLESLGVAVERRPFELHPDLPVGGRPVRPGGRLASVYERIGAACAELGRPFRPPTHVSNSRRALETAEVVRAIDPAAFVALDDALFRAVFVEGRDVADRATLDELVSNAGVDAAAVRAAVDRGEGRGPVDDSRVEAIDRGVAATPTWLVAGRLLIPGVQPRETVIRWIERLRERMSAPDTPATY